MNLLTRSLIKEQCKKFGIDFYKLTDSDLSLIIEDVNILKDNLIPDLSRKMNIKELIYEAIEHEHLNYSFEYQEDEE